MSKEYKELCEKLEQALALHHQFFLYDPDAYTVKADAIDYTVEGIQYNLKAMYPLISEDLAKKLAGYMHIALDSYIDKIEMKMECLQKKEAKQ